MRLWLAILALGAASVARGEVTVCQSTPVYEPCELSFEMTDAEAQQNPNPYETVELRAEFRSPKGGTTMVMPGFWDGGKTFRIRFSPDFEGRWDLRILSNLPSVDRKILSFQATAPTRPGFIHVFNTRYFRYSAPNTAHFWMGDTCYRLAMIPWETFTAYVDKRAEQKFNHMRGLALGWEEMAKDVLADPKRPKVEHFRELDRRVTYMNAKGMTYDVLFAGDQNELVNLLPERRDRDRYVRYLVARLAAYNVVWQGVQEFEEYPDGRKVLKELYDVVRKNDPYDHPRSTHTVRTSSPLIEDGWMTYIVEQNSAPSLASIDYETHTMPVVNAEFAYENSGAGASHPHHVSSEEFRKRLWDMAVRGHYVTFGNTGTYGGRKFDVDLKYADSPGATFMTHFYDFFTQTRWFDLQPYYKVEGGVAISLDYLPYWAEERKGVEFIVYMAKPGPLDLLIPKDGYDVSWVNPIDGTWIDEKKKFKGDRFTVDAPPEATHDWVLYVRKEGKKESWNKSFFLEARGVKPKDVETVDVPFEIQLPELEALKVGESYDFNATLTKSSRAAKEMLFVWTAEVAGAGKTTRVLGTEQFGKLKIPANLADIYPATLSVRLLGLDGAGRLYESFKAYRLEKE